MVANFGSNVNDMGGGSRSGGGSQTMAYKVLPGEFATLKKGGPVNKMQVEAIITQGGRIWQATGDTYIKVVFKQE